MKTLIYILGTVALTAANTPKCSAPSGSTMSITDGKGNARCISVVTPSAAKKPMPVLFWFHGAGGNGGNCGEQRSPEGKSWSELASENGFAFVCGEALQDAAGPGGGHGGQWQIPEVVTDATGNKCNSTDTVEVGYLQNALAALAKSPDTYDMSRVFTSGCSMGSAFSFYSASCLAKSLPQGHITAFATHSTGIKVKGDGNRLPPDNYNPDYTWGECPSCQYFPAMAEKNGLKACVFDNVGDSNFYPTSVALGKKWKMLGNKVETFFGSGGHCQIHSFNQILNCLDDGTGRLLSDGPLPVAPTPAPAPAPGPSPGPGPAPGPGPGPAPGPVSAACLAACAKVCPNLEGQGATCDACLKKHQWESTMLQACPPAPFSAVQSEFCGSTLRAEDKACTPDAKCDGTGGYNCKQCGDSSLPAWSCKSGTCCTGHTETSFAGGIVCK